MPVVIITTDSGKEVTRIDPSIWPCFNYPDARNVYDRLGFENAVYRGLNLAALEEKDERGNA
jgi:hypothetical protein